MIARYSLFLYIYIFIQLFYSSKIKVFIFSVTPKTFFYFLKVFTVEPLIWLLKEKKLFK